MIIYHVTMAMCIYITCKKCVTVGYWKGSNRLNNIQRRQLPLNHATTWADAVCWSLALFSFLSSSILHLNPPPTPWFSLTTLAYLFSFLSFRSRFSPFIQSTILRFSPLPRTHHHPAVIHFFSAP